MILVLACVLSCLLAGCNKSAMPTNSSGEYWTTYSNIPGPPDTFKELNVKGPFYINRVNIGERSTAELLATVNFTKDQTFGTDTEEKYNTKFWVEKIDV